jgi:protein-S-isoprenylcysteine O-methyltransferase Ste14
MILVKTIIFAILAPGTVAVLMPYWLLSASSPPPLTQDIFRYFGCLPILTGTAILFLSGWNFIFIGKGTPAPIDPPKELVVKGIYRYVRNPMYLGIISILLGEALFFESKILLVYAAVVFCLFHMFILFYEEPVLKKKFGEPYREYCVRIPRWIPRILKRHKG